MIWDVVGDDNVSLLLLLLLLLRILLFSRERYRLSLVLDHIMGADIYAYRCNGS